MNTAKEWLCLGFSTQLLRQNTLPDVRALDTHTMQSPVRMFVISAAAILGVAVWVAFSFCRTRFNTFHWNWMQRWEQHWVNSLQRQIMFEKIEILL